MAILHFIEQGIAAACRAVLYLTLGVVFFILSANVALRYVAGTSIASASELPELLFPWMIMAGVVLAAQHGSHIAVVILTQKLGAARRWVLAAGTLTVAVLYAGLAVAAWPVMEIAADERSPILQVPGSVSVGCVLLGFALLSVVSLCKLPEVWAGDEVPHGHEAAEPAAAHQGV
jgi:TRAP-type C4-dicarboxylate transport system permease small subunit